MQVLVFDDDGRLVLVQELEYQGKSAYMAEQERDELMRIIAELSEMDGE